MATGGAPAGCFALDRVSPRRRTCFGDAGKRPPWVELPLLDTRKNAIRQHVTGVSSSFDAWVEGDSFVEGPVTNDRLIMWTAAHI